MLTLSNPATVEIEVRRSRFIAHASRVDSLAETLAFYESVADPTATHNCWAWKLDHRHRFNDDGEPASTAGKPILAAIEGKGLDHVMVVVTRHFGGTKLGVGGLVRAYSGCASRCIDQAMIVEIRPTVTCVVKAAFNWTGQIYAALETCGAARLSEDFGDDGVNIRIEISDAEFDRFRSLLGDLTRGEASVRKSA